jgi:hypothetical protein
MAKTRLSGSPPRRCTQVMAYGFEVVRGALVMARVVTEPVSLGVCCLADGRPPRTLHEIATRRPRLGRHGYVGSSVFRSQFATIYLSAIHFGNSCIVTPLYRFLNAGRESHIDSVKGSESPVFAFFTCLFCMSPLVASYLSATIGISRLSRSRTSRRPTNGLTKRVERQYRGSSPSRIIAVRPEFRIK